MSREKGGRDGVNVPTEDLEPNPENVVSPSPALDVDKKSVPSLTQGQDLEFSPPAPKPQERQQKDKSYVVALLGS